MYARQFITFLLLFENVTIQMLPYVEIKRIELMVRSLSCKPIRANVTEVRFYWNGDLYSRHVFSSDDAVENTNLLRSEINTNVASGNIKIFHLNTSPYEAIFSTEIGNHPKFSSNYSCTVVFNNGSVQTSAVVHYVIPEEPWVNYHHSIVLPFGAMLNLSCMYRPDQNETGRYGWFISRQDRLNRSLAFQASEFVGKVYHIRLTFAILYVRCYILFEGRVKFAYVHKFFAETPIIELPGVSGMSKKDQFGRFTMYRVLVAHRAISLSCKHNSLHTNILYEWKEMGNKETSWSATKETRKHISYHPRANQVSVLIYCSIVFPTFNVSLASQILHVRFNKIIVDVPACNGPWSNSSHKQCRLFTKMTFYCQVMNYLDNQVITNYLWISPLPLSGKTPVITFTQKAAGMYRCGASTANGGTLVSDPVEISARTDHCVDLPGFGICQNARSKGHCKYYYSKCPVECGLCDANTTYPSIPEDDIKAAKMNSKITLRCMARPPQPKLAFSWFKDRKELLIKANTLDILLTEASLGSYHCNTNGDNRNSNLLTLFLCCESDGRNETGIQTTVACTDICTKTEKLYVEVSLNGNDRVVQMIGLNFLTIIMCKFM